MLQIQHLHLPSPHPLPEPPRHPPVESVHIQINSLRHRQPRGDSPCKAIIAQIHRPRRYWPHRPNRAGELVPLQIDTTTDRKREENTRYLTRELVPAQIQVVEIGEFDDDSADAAGEPVRREGQVFEGGREGREAAGEIVALEI